MAARVRGALAKSWAAYKQHAWPHDELKPLSKSFKDWHPPESLLMTPVDTLDKLLLLGLTKEADEGKQIIVDTLAFDKDIVVKNFEITIRVLGGLLSAYEMTGDERRRSTSTQSSSTRRRIRFGAVKSCHPLADRIHAWPLPAVLTLTRCY
ncbi:MAG TPA: glycoside hydrolase family 47 protein [Thermoanaerobaculia bacterium]|nr:glycoside hydrolase family 47 protein [Thermoanaerobaculia bacterium]